MDKQQFLGRVRQALLRNGVSEATVERQLARLSQYIDEEGGSNVPAMLAGEDPELLAEEICASLRRNAAKRAAQPAPAPAQPKPQPVQPKPAPAQPKPAPAQPKPAPSTPAAATPLTPTPRRPVQTAQPIVPTVTVRRPVQPTHQTTPTPARPTAPTPTPPPTVDATRTREMEIVHPSQTFDIVDLNSATTVQPAADFTDAGADEIYLPPIEDEPVEEKHHRGGLYDVDHLRSRAVEYEDEKGGPLFWVAFILALPFAAVIALAVLILFIAAFATLTVLMIASIAALILVAAVGTAFTLISLVYGIVQALSVLPVGLYEIGIGITAGAIVLFTSILLYNFAIRLMPFTMKQLGRFFGWTVRSLRALFIYVKGACAKL